jgi:hypothetical protein
MDLAGARRPKWLLRVTGDFGLPRLKEIENAIVRSIALSSAKAGRY